MHQYSHRTLHDYFPNVVAFTGTAKTMTTAQYLEEAIWMNYLGRPYPAALP